MSNNKNEISELTEKKSGFMAKLKAMKKEDKIIATIIAVIVIAVIAVCASYYFSSGMEEQHQKQLRAEANMPECEHVQEAQSQLFTTKEQMKAKIKDGFNEYWKEFEKNYWVVFKESHETNYPSCFVAQTEE